MKRFMQCMLIICMAVAINACSGEQEEIRIGVLSDLSGPTSAVGQPYAEGIMDCIEWVNANGGIDGVMIKPMQVDYAYNVQQALSAYKKFINDGIVAMQGWGTGDTEALTEFVARDHIPNLSASYSAHLADPAKAPYNFFIAADYSTQVRGALQYLIDNWTEDRAPRLAFIYPDHPYGLAPIPAAKEYAQELGFEIVGEENVELNAMDATTQLLSLQQVEPDFIWLGGTTSSASVVMKDAAKLNMDVVFFTNIWGADENTFQLAGEAGVGNISLQSAVIYGTDVEGMEIIKQITNNEPQMTHYIRGFASMYTMVEALRIAKANGEITGETIKAALESMRDFDCLGLTPPISFFPDDHRPNMSVNLYEIGLDSMKFLKTQTLERRAEWLGH